MYLQHTAIQYIHILYISGLDTKSEPCQRFFREGLSQSFQKILNDEAVHSWKYEIQVMLN